MVTLFKAQGLLVESHGRVRLAEAAEEHLVASSPWFLGPYFASLKERSGAVDLLEVMRTGKPVFWGGRQERKDDWHVAMEDDAYAERFTSAMDCRGVFLGQAAARAVDLSGVSTLLDIAGGSGIYACAFVARHPHLSAAVLEKPPVDAMATRMIAKRGFAERVSVITADMLAEPLPRGFDAHLWSNVLHDWDIPDVEKLLAASFAALPPRGMFIMHDAFLNEAKDGPLHVAEYSVTLAHATQGRCYGTGEMRGWLGEAGFDRDHLLRHRRGSRRDDRAEALRPQTAREDSASSLSSRRTSRVHHCRSGRNASVRTHAAAGWKRCPTLVLRTALPTLRPAR